MPLVTTKEMLRRAREKGYAVGAFNANNMESVKAVLETCDELGAPVILQVSQGAIKYAGLHYATAMVKAGAEAVKIPVALHLDHGTSFEQNCQCLAAGFTSLMFDGSKLPYEENVETTALICRVGHAAGVPVEAELGIIPKIEEGLSQEEIENLMTDPEQAKDFHERTGCDSLAVAIGAVHGMTERGSQLDFDRLQRLMDLIDIPFVLHGSSGIPFDQVKRACEMGVCKVNVATRISMALLQGTKERLEEEPDQKDFRKVFDKGMERISEVIRQYVELFGAAGQAYGAGWTPAELPEINEESPE